MARRGRYEWTLIKILKRGNIFVLFCGIIFWHHSAEGFEGAGKLSEGLPAVVRRTPWRRSRTRALLEKSQRRVSNLGEQRIHIEDREEAVDFVEAKDIRPCRREEIMQDTRDIPRPSSGHHHSVRMSH